MTGRALMAEERIGDGLYPEIPQEISFSPWYPQQDRG